MWTRLCPSLSLWCPLSKQMLGTSWKGCLNFQPCGNRYLAKSLSLSLALSLSLSLSLFLYIYIICVSTKYQFTFPNIHCAISCNNPVWFLFEQGVWQQPVLHTEIWSHHHSVCLEQKQNKLRQTKSRRTVAMSPRCFKRPTCKATWKTMHKCNLGKSWFKRKGWSHQMF